MWIPPFQASTLEEGNIGQAPFTPDPYLTDPDLAFRQKRSEHQLDTAMVCVVFEPQLMLSSIAMYCCFHFPGDV